MKKQIENNSLRLMIFKSADELGQKIDDHLLEMYNLNKDEYTFIVPIKENFFEDGHFKVEIEETVIKLIRKCNARGGQDNISIAYLIRESGEEE